MYPGGEVVGVIRNINPDKEAHTGIGFVNARGPLHQETYDLCLQELHKSLDTRLPIHVAKQLLIRNESWVRTKVVFAEPCKNSKGLDETPQALWQGTLLGQPQVEELYQPGGWLRTAFTYSPQYLKGLLTQINLGGLSEGRRHAVPALPGVPPFNRGTLEPMFKAPQVKNKKRGT